METKKWPDRKGFIATYCIEILASGRRYYGSTNDFKRRRGHHRCELRKRRHFNAQLQAAFDQHGSDALAFIVLDRPQTRNEALILENRYIMADKDCLNQVVAIAPQKKPAQFLSVVRISPDGTEKFYPRIKDAIPDGATAKGISDATRGIISHHRGYKWRIAEAA